MDRTWNGQSTKEASAPRGPGEHSGQTAASETPGGTAQQNHTNPELIAKSPEPPTKLRDPDARVLWDAECAARKAEAERLEALLKYVDAKTDQARDEGRVAYEALQAREAPVEVLRLCANSAQDAVDMAQRAGIMYAADALKCSEHHAASLHLTAHRARTELPKVWKNFQAGLITTMALRSITRVLDHSLKDSTVDKLDEKASEYAIRYRPVQLNDWLRRFTAREEPTEASERFHHAAKTRYVGVKDLDDGMSMLTAVMPTITAHSIRQKLEAVARSSKQAVPHNPLIANQAKRQEQRLTLTKALQQWMWDARHSDGRTPSSTDPENWEIGQAAQQMARSLQDHAFGPGNEHSLPGGLHITDGAPIGHPELSHEDNISQAMTPSGDTAGHEPETRQDGDPRNIEQRAVDMLTAWLLGAESANGIEIDAHIGILVPESTLTGETDQPAVTRNGQAVIPGPQIRDMLQHQRNKLKWFEISTRAEPDRSPQENPEVDSQEPSISECDPDSNPAHGEDILSFRSVGRYPPPRLRQALLFRDGTCCADGCRTSAEVCDIDHITPWPEGPTTAENLQVLCRRHHRLKTAGYDVASRYIKAA